MLRRTSLFVIAVLLFAACNIGRQQPNPNTLLNTDKLPTSEITIDISQENTLRTSKGTIINIPAGAIDSDTDRVTIMIQEAYTMQEMIQGGLTTKTNGIPLSSGGMIYIDTKEQSSVRRPIKVLIPNSFQQKGMQVYKGFKDVSGEINWNDPTALSDTPTHYISQFADTSDNLVKSTALIGGAVTLPTDGYYGFNIEAMAWYSIATVVRDLPDVQQCKLTVNIDGTPQQHVYLIIPEYHMFLSGGPLRNSTNEYAFFTNDGLIPLPQGAEAYAISMSVQDNTISYGHTSTKINTDQQLQLTMHTVDKKQLGDQIATITN